MLATRADGVFLACRTAKHQFHVIEAKEYSAKRPSMGRRNVLGRKLRPRLSRLGEILMFRLDADKRVHFCDGVSRRDFLHAGSLGFLGLTMPHFFRLKAAGAVQGGKGVNCIHLMLVGGPRQLGTWDMKPDAPDPIRGPFKPIKTNVSGIEISEIFP